MVGRHATKGWSKTQSFVAFISGESGLCATLKAAAEALGTIPIWKDVGWKVAGEIWSDASAALGIINPRGLGKTRHLDIGLLRAQQTSAEKRLQFNNVQGKHNPADLYTKHMGANTIDRHTTTMAFEFAEGSANEAPKLHVLQSNDDDMCRCAKDVCNALNGARV